MVDELDIGWVKFDCDGFAGEFEGYLGGGAATGEGVEDGVADLAPCQDAEFGDFGWEGGEVCVWVGVSGDAPDAAFVAGGGLLAVKIAFIEADVTAEGDSILFGGAVGWIAVNIGVAVAAALAGFPGWLLDGLGVVEVGTALSEEKDIFVGFGGAVSDALGHGVGFSPDDVLP